MAEGSDRLRPFSVMPIASGPHGGGREKVQGEGGGIMRPRGHPLPSRPPVGILFKGRELNSQSLRNRNIHLVHFYT